MYMPVRGLAFVTNVAGRMFFVYGMFLLGLRGWEREAAGVCFGWKWKDGWRPRIFFCEPKVYILV